MGAVASLFPRSDNLQLVTVDVHAANDLIRSGHRYLDVRTHEEFNRGHVDVENCVNIPYFFFNPAGRVKNTKFLEQVSAVCSKDDHIVVIHQFITILGCQSGVRSGYATTDLLKAGYKHVSNMEGGYASWVENELSVKKSDAEL
ncbi:thiosulfate sulfurtransferase 18-like isoform X2 [Chenopodium quinoa]|uniref:thiosulfate sulfurtransferase 18-like isoform X2 n=1 Tax=Chenopodium quinoa TaxID=63459 RepID=UPI000B77F963|nr:thiosulfate sulfurtransferase 18-like isoform X2 [Chenopodium quinoa]